MVRSAGRTTLGAASVGIEIASGDAVVAGRLDLARGVAAVTVRSRSTDGREVPLTIDYRRAYLEGAVLGGVPAGVPAQLVGAGVQPGNPLVVLDLLAGAVGVEAYGGAAVRGASTLRYEGVVNPEAAIAAAPAERRDILAAALRALGATAIPLDVWVDQAGRVRRTQLGDDLRALTTTTDRRGIPVVTTLDLFDFSPP
ncbi:MAG: hypothetical protein ACRD0F_05605 [Acidimicrobiales bacterium]